MQYRGHDFKYDDETGEVEGENAQEPQANKQYRRKRSIQAKRRSSKKTPNSPGCGIGGSPQQPLELVAARLSKVRAA